MLPIVICIPVFIELLSHLLICTFDFSGSEILLYLYSSAFCILHQINATAMNEQFDRKPDNVYSKRLKAGKRRTYFFDVRATRANDYFLTITESRKRMNDDGYDRHKIFLYKEDFHKFIKGLQDAVSFVKTELMPDFDFDSFNHDGEEVENGLEDTSAKKPLIAPELLTATAFDGTNNKKDGATLAQLDIIDGTERPGFTHENDGISTSDGKTIGVPDPVNEEVDKW